MKRKIHALLASVLVSLPIAASAQDTTPGENLGGYDAIAAGAAISFQPFLQSFVSTGDVPFEVTFGHSTSRVKSGNIASGRAAILWPGATLADFGPVLGAGFGEPELGALVPKWPMQAEANQDTGGDVTTGAPPIATMRATGHPDQGGGDARIADINVPNLVHIEHIASTSASVVTDQSVTSTARVVLQGVTMLAGYVKAEEIRSVSRTTSTGGAASSTGDVDITGLKIGGAVVSVTDDGFHVAGLPPDFQSAPGAGEEPFPDQSPEEAVNSLLEALGARITLFNSTSRVAGGQAQRTQPGVVISLDNPVGGQGPFPPGRFDIFLASTTSSSLGTVPFSVGVSSVAPPGVIGGSEPDAGGPISIGGGPEVDGGALTAVGDGLADAAAGDLGPVPGFGDALPQRSDYAFDGLPLGLVLLLFLFALLAARYIRNFFSSLIARTSGTSDEQGSV